MKGTWVWSPVQKDSTCLGATESMYQNYRSPNALQPMHCNEKPPPRWEAHVLWLEKSPCTTTKTQCSHKEINRTEDKKVSVVEKEMATHSSVLAWRIPGTGEPGGLPSMGSPRVEHDWSNLAAAAAAAGVFIFYLVYKENSPFLLSLSLCLFILSWLHMLANKQRRFFPLKIWKMEKWEGVKHPAKNDKAWSNCLQWPLKHWSLFCQEKNMLYWQSHNSGISTMCILTFSRL